MKAVAMKALISMMLKVLSEQDLKLWADRALDIVEDKVADTSTPWDDAMLLPVCAMIRKAFDIPDND